MKGVQRVDVGTLLQVTQALEAVLGPCFGPSGGQVLFTRDTGDVLITRDGQHILSSLRLDHPIARVLVECVSAHCDITGDGAKSFLLLLGALLRGIHGDCLRGVQVGRTARALLSFQTLVLDDVIGRSLFLHAPPLLLHSPTHLRALTDAYFRGKTASCHWAVLSRTACEFHQRWRCGPEGAGLALLSRHLPALLTAVPGLPVTRSRVLRGLLIHRDFAVLCPAAGAGPLRALAVSEPLQAPLAPPGVTLGLASAAQVRRCLEAGAQVADRAMASLCRLGVGLLLSGAKQSEPALALAQREGVSVLECVDPDELALFCQLAGAQLFAGHDWSLLGEEHVATVTFCKPVVLGPDRLAHVGFPEGRGLVPHSLVLCGPSPGLAEQCTTAFHGLFRMLQRVFEPVQSPHSQGPVQSPHSQGPVQSPHSQGPVQSPHSQGPVQSPHSQGPVQSPHSQGPVQSPHSQGPVQSPHSQGPSISDNAHLSTDGTETRGPPDRGEGPQALIRAPSRGEGPLCAGQSQNPLITEPKAEPELQTVDWVQNGKAPGGQPGVHFGNGKEEAWGSCALEAGAASSGVLIAAGSVLPAGGAFEFLLHHHLLQRASQCPCPDLRAACRLVAGAVLSLPRRLYPGRRFLEAQVHFLGPSGAVTPGQATRGLESLACKYQLLLSVLHTLTSLLSIDLILHAHVSSQEEPSEEEDEGKEGHGD
ncbi:hypothetical protein COCON_G00209470 [Conger conger]|uniref:Bardet-Biedl syndrome 10 protein n=1 Tax=Conger conger TaxID=82655 RepID=A0A9Q1CZR1_CONCO|nr:hypothetical protein COCON_G00209470 [Conger conger]